jgi:hypothetical protein
MYWFHLFISSLPIEAVSKVVGGLYYSYAVRDGQMIMRAVTKEDQLNALNAITDCIDPKVLEISEKIIKLILRA